MSTSSNKVKKIVIDGRMYNESGVGRYIKNLLSYLKKLDKHNEYFILHLQKDYDTLVYHNNFHKVVADFRWYGVSEQIKLPSIIKNLNADLVHFPHFNVPIFYKGRYVVTIHDLIHQHFEMKRATTLDPLTYKIKNLGYRKIFKNSITLAEKILVPSNFVKRQLINEWNVDSEKIVVTHEAVEDKFITTIGKNSLIEGQYIFYVGNAHPHKNVEGLIKAFLLIKHKYTDLKLVLSGHDHYFWQRIKKEYGDPDIIFTGFVSDEELVILYQNAKIFVMPSYEEGFGIPLLEAMACGCPVLSSNAGALPEVGGDAVSYFNPKDTNDMADKILDLLQNEKLKDELIKKGKNRIQQFSWESLAKQTLEVYLECMSR